METLPSKEQWRRGAATESKGDWIDYPVPPELVKVGFIKIAVELKDGSTAKPVWEDVLLWVRNKKEK